MPTQTEIMEKIVALCRRRGFIFGSSEIYGGIGGFWDYGPLGCELKRNVKDVWWEDMVRNPPMGPNGREYQMVGVDCSIIMNPKVWEASGHVGGFSDPMVPCKTEGCRRLFRADKVWYAQLAPPECYGPDTAKQLKENGRADAQGWEPTPDRMKNYRIAMFESDGGTGVIAEALEAIHVLAKKKNDIPMKGFKFLPSEHPALGGLLAGEDSGGNLYGCQIGNLARGAFMTSFSCPVCGGEILPPRDFNLMFESHAGAVKDDSNKVYLRPETAQGIFVNFKNVMDSTRVKIPFGIAQVGKAFRNEVNPRNYTFRSREFEQMEIEFFCHPNESRMWYEYWRDVRKGWYSSLGIKSGNLRPREQGTEELAHYSCGTTDIEYMFPFSGEPQELEGVAHRGSFDLEAHGNMAKGSKDAFAVFDDETKEKFVPHVIEPSAGADRFTLAVICEAYTFDESRASPEFMKFHPRLAPIKAAVFPLVAKDGMPEIAEPIYREIKKHFPCQYDAKQAIGKRYARMDEAGTPFCFTVDGQSKEDGTVTVRDRDDASQSRINKSQCLQYLRDKLKL